MVDVVDLEMLELNYFVNMSYVPYELKKGGTIYIKPILVKDYLTYSWSKEILNIPKNKINDVEIIQMSYLQFIAQFLLQDKAMLDSFVNILLLCLDFHYPKVAKIDNKLVLLDKEKKIIINSKQFDDIKKIILYQKMF